MKRQHSRPRWGVLYLVLPLAGLLFWQIHQAWPAGTMRSLLDIGALLFVFVFVEVWRLANSVALLCHPLAGGDGGPLYHAREAVPAAPARIPAVFAAESQGELISVEKM